MKRLAFLIGVLLLSMAAVASEVVKIKEVGLSHYRTTGGPTPVRLQISNPRPEVLTLTLEIRVSPDTRREISSQFTKRMTLAAQQTREIELPVVLPAGNDTVVDVTALDGAHRTIGYASTEGALIANPSGLIAVLCVDLEVCSSIQTAIMLSGDAKDLERKKDFIRFATLTQPYAQWWSYAAAHTLIVAAPMAGYTSEQKRAIEQYLRSGGDLIVFGREIGDESFLAPYRSGDSGKNSAQRVGKGKLYFSSLSPYGLGEMFAGEMLDKHMQQSSEWRDAGDPRLNWLAEKVVPRFPLPKFRWLLIWLASYIALLGLVNFWLLRRFRRLEWGWVTITLCALLFSAWLYASNYRRGPRHFDCVDLAILWMDPSSPLAFADYGVSLSSPKRTTAVLSVAGDAVLQPMRSDAAPKMAQDIYTEITGKYHVDTWRVALDDPQKIAVPMLRWSAHHLGFSGFQRFDGTVHWTAPLRLRNDTGAAIFEAVVVDRPNLKIWMLPALPPGQEVDLAAIPSRPLRFREMGEFTFEPDDISLAEGVARRCYGEAKVFAGRIDAGSLPVELEERNVTWRKVSLLLVPLP